MSQRNKFIAAVLAGASLIMALLSTGATYSFFSPTQTTNVVNGLITAGTYQSSAFNVNQFNVTPYSLIQIKPGALTTNMALTTPTLSYPITTGGTITGGTNSGTALLSVTTPGLTGYLYGNGGSAITTSVPTDSRIVWTNTIVDLPSIAAQDHFDVTRTMTGATTASTVTISIDGGGHTNVICTAWIDSANSVTIRAFNTWTAAADPASATFRLTCINHN